MNNDDKLGRGWRYLVAFAVGVSIAWWLLLMALAVAALLILLGAIDGPC